jgi:hypothetical protein
MGTAQHRDLVPQNEQLRVFGRCGPVEQNQPTSRRKTKYNSRSATLTIMLSGRRRTIAAAQLATAGFWYPTGGAAARPQASV